MPSRHIFISHASEDDAFVKDLRIALECFQPYGHAAQPWMAWGNLYDLEQATNHPEAAAQARRQAIESFLIYRRDGGENHEPGTQLCAEVAQVIRQGQTAEATAALTQILEHPDIQPWAKALIPKLQTILAGSCDPTLADNPVLYYMDAVELRLLLEDLGSGS